MQQNIGMLPYFHLTNLHIPKTEWFNVLCLFYIIRCLYGTTAQGCMVFANISIERKLNKFLNVIKFMESNMANELENV